MIIIPGLPPAASSWTLTSAAAAAISYADRGTSAIAASGILSDLGWSESQLGTVQSSFFLGYGLTQVVGGLLSETGEDDHQHVDEGGPQTRNNNKRPRREAFRTVLPVSIALTALATLAFPAAATYGGPALASIDRFLLGVFEGLLLPSANVRCLSARSIGQEGHGIICTDRRVLPGQRSGIRLGSNIVFQPPGRYVADTIRMAKCILRQWYPVVCMSSIISIGV